MGVRRAYGGNKDMEEAKEEIKREGRNKSVEIIDQMPAD